MDQVAAAEQAELRAHMDEEIAWARDQALGVPGLQSECRAHSTFCMPHDLLSLRRLCDTTLAVCVHAGVGVSVKQSLKVEPHLVIRARHKFPGKPTIGS